MINANDTSPNRALRVLIVVTASAAAQSRAISPSAISCSAFEQHAKHPKPAAIDRAIEITLMAAFAIIGIPLAIIIAIGLLLKWRLRDERQARLSG